MYSTVIRYLCIIHYSIIGIYSKQIAIIRPKQRDISDCVSIPLLGTSRIDNV